MTTRPANPETRERNQQQYETDQAIAAIRANARAELIQDAQGAVIEAAKTWVHGKATLASKTRALAEAVAKLEALELAAGGGDR